MSLPKNTVYALWSELTCLNISANIWNWPACFPQQWPDFYYKGKEHVRLQYVQTTAAHLFYWKPNVLNCWSESCAPVCYLSSSVEKCLIGPFVASERETKINAIGNDTLQHEPQCCRWRSGFLQTLYFVSVSLDVCEVSVDPLWPGLTVIY